MSIKLAGNLILGNVSGGPSALNLSDLHDVSIVSPQNNQYLKYNSTTSDWYNSYINSDVFSSFGTPTHGVTVSSSGNLIIIGLGAITPASVNTSGSITASNFTGTSSGTNTGDQTITLTGDITGSGTGSFSTTLATVNSSPQIDQFRKITVTGKGLITSTSAVLASDITTALGYTPVNKSGDTLTGTLTMTTGATITGLPTPVLDSDAATKQYADNISAGANIHASCETATSVALPACTYNNGTAGVGATLTANANGALGTVGGYSGLAVSSRVLVKNQATQTQNGIYVVTQLGSGGTPWILTRSTDFDGSPTSEVEAGDLTYAQEGSNAGTQWVQINVGTGHNTSPAYDYILIGTDNIVFTQFAGTGTYTAGSGINISLGVISNSGVLSNIAGTGISVSGATGNVTVTNTGVTSAAAGTGISVSASTGAVTFSTSNIPNASLTNSSVTVGSTNISLGATSTTLAGLSSVTSTSFVGSLTGASSLNVLKSGDTMSGTLVVTDISYGTIANTDDATLTTSTISPNQVVTAFAVATYRSAKFQIQVTSGSAYQMTEVLVIHDGTTAYMTEYGTVNTGSILATFDTDISGGSVRLLTTPVNAVTVYKTLRTAITV